MKSLTDIGCTHESWHGLNGRRLTAVEAMVEQLKRPSMKSSDPASPVKCALAHVLAEGVEFVFVFFHVVADLIFGDRFYERVEFSPVEDDN